MKLPICSFEIAKELMNLGFNEGTLKGYTHKGVLETPHYGTIFYNQDDNNSVSFEAPILALVQMWLREKFDIHVFCVTDTSSSNGYYYVLEGENGLNYNLPYDEALEAGILEAIKLIKTKQDD